MPTNMLKFTHAKIDELPIPTARMTYMDPSAPTGLRLRVTETGAKAWYWLHRVDGKMVCSQAGQLRRPDARQGKATGAGTERGRRQSQR